MRGGFSVPSRAWGVGQEHGSLCGDIHLHPLAHLLSASRCQDNLLAAQAQLSSDGRGRRNTDSYCFFLRERGRGPAKPIMLGLCPQPYPSKGALLSPPPPPSVSQDWFQDWPGGNHNSGPDNRLVGRMTALVQAAHGVGGER